ncbi:hypothetical protein Hte_008071 [Hypoxylon texense]
MMEMTCKLVVDGQPCGEECDWSCPDTCDKHTFQRRTLYSFYKAEEKEASREYSLARHEETESGSVSRCKMAYNHYTAALAGRELTTNMFYKGKKDKEHLTWESGLRSRRTDLIPLYGDYLMHRKNTDQEFSDRLKAALLALTPPEPADSSLGWGDAIEKGHIILWEALAGLEGIEMTKDESPREITKYEPDISEEEWLKRSPEHWSNQVNKDWSKQSDDLEGEWSSGPQLSDAEIERFGF